MEVAKPTVANVSMATANTEYTYDVPANTRFIFFKLRNVESYGQVGIDEGESGTTYITMNQGETLREPVKRGGTTLYFRSDNNSDTAEIITFK